MARGWESKSVESQMQEAEEKPSGRLMTAEEAASQRRREFLRLARSRVMQQLEIAREPRYVKLLQNALSDLDARLKKLK